MLTFEELYKKVAAATKSKDVDEDLIKLEYDPYHLECVLRPDKTPIEWQNKHKKCGLHGKYFIECLFDHLEEDGDKKKFQLKNEICQSCLDMDKVNKVLKSDDSMAVLDAIHKRKQPVFAEIAPAFLSQFEIVSDGQLRSAFKQIGFAGMVEVSLFADILTLKEALQFDKDITNEEDFQLTSCCCPIWISLIRKNYPELLHHVPNAVSPMVATGRVLKKLIPNAFTVFVGPCLAKKREAKEKDIADAVDVVLTFQEIKEIFEAARINAEELPSDLREHSSRAGRIYAVTSGVSESVRSTVDRIRPERPIKVKAKQADGVVDCKLFLNEIKDGKVDANFLEGMGCIGGCVGGPKSLIDTDVASNKVEKYANESLYPTPIDNPYVIEMLHRLKFNTIEELLNDHEIFSRHLHE